MKKLLKLCLILLLFPVLVLAESVTIKNIEVVDKSEGLEIDDPLVEGLNININPKFEKVGDFVKYKLTIKNNEEKKLEVTPVNTTNANVSYELTNLTEMDKNGESEVELLIKYNTLIANNYYKSTDEIGFLFELKDDIVIPLPEKEEEKKEDKEDTQEEAKEDTQEEAKEDKKDSPKEIRIPTPEVPYTVDNKLKIALSVLALSLTAYGIVILVYKKKVKYTIPLGVGLIAMCSVFFIGDSHANIALSIKVNTTIEPSNYLYNMLLKTEAEKNTVFEAEDLIATKTAPDFSLAVSTNEGLFKTEDDEGNSYYYRGDVQNNHVIFGDFCWRIVRTTGSGGVKLIYDGVQSSGVCSNTGAATHINSVGFNNNHDSLAYIGYMYGEARITNSDTITTKGTNVIFSNDVTYNSETNMYELDMSDSFEMVPSDWKQSNASVNYTNVLKRHYTCLDNRTSCSEVYYVNAIYSEDKKVYYQTLTNGEKIEDLIDKMLTSSDNSNSSNAKTQIDAWYETNLISYDTYLEDTIFCNDRSIANYGGWNKDNTNYDGWMIFGSRNRNNNLNTPSLTCANLNDKFTVSDGKGNGKLTYPIGLLTADEIVLAGGKNNTSNGLYYPYNGQDEWTLSPYSFDSGNVREWYMNNLGSLSNRSATFAYGLRPVISLKAGTIITSGDGSSATPYIVETN